MRWTVLSDNRSYDSCLFTEHGLSVLLQTERHKILLDTGASDVFVRNAEQLGIDLSDVGYVFISHGHSDHAGGLRYFLEHNQNAQVIVSPDAMSGKFFSKRGNLHSITTEWPEIGEDRLVLIDQTCEILEGLHVIAHIPWPVHTVIGGFHLLDGQETDDEIKALAQRLKAMYPETQFYTSHCTGDHVFEVMKDVMGEQLQSFRCGTIIA